MSDRLFVYGTLRRGEVNAHQLTRIPEGRWEPATIHGRVAWLTLGGRRYPALVLDPAAGPVLGLIFSAPTLASHWSRLDQFEGPSYRRVVATAQDEQGDPVEVHVYVRATPPAR